MEGGEGECGIRGGGGEDFEFDFYQIILILSG